MNNSFSSKSDTLKVLENKLTHAIVLPQVSSTVHDFSLSPDKFWQTTCQPLWFNKEVIVRSSSHDEDTPNSSNAGKYESISNVKGKVNILAAIKNVIASYGSSENSDQFFIQPMLKNIAVSGVAFSIDPNTGGHYFVINYDDTSNSTDSVTSGKSNELKLAYVVKNQPNESNNPIVKSVVNILKELEKHFNEYPIDIEFAIDTNGKAYLLQVRKLITPVKIDFTAEQQVEHLLHASTRFEQMSNRHPYLLGEKAVFGIMPDWNPAEIIGTKPKPLSLSLYRELITDSIWAYQRDNYGYRKLRSFPLMIDFLGMPYIDARISFNSFIPATLEESTAEKLVNYYVDSLIKSPFLHDKVEFDVIYSCYSFDLKDKLHLLNNNGFQDIEISNIFDALKNLTNKIIGNNGLWRKDIDKITTLKEKQNVILKSSLSPIEKIYWLIEDCKRYGTLPFAGLARAGFIAVQMLDSMVKTNILTAKEKDEFLRSLDTVSSTLSNDLMELEKEQFLKKYGHLRPGTYDILSPRYDEEPESYFNWNQLKQTPPPESRSFSVTIETLNKLNCALQNDGIELDAIGLFNFIRAAIEGREYAKFVFTKSLSSILSIVSETANELNISNDDASYFDINVFKESYISARPLKSELSKNITTGKEKYRITNILRLPPLIIDKSDFWQFNIPSNQPNYVTQKLCNGKVLPYSKNKVDMKNKILFIENADPGYDWIFSAGIKGFVTQYGGINSHMAIRASELGIPAVIGAGESLFKLWLKFDHLEIDCANKTVRTVG